MISFYEPSDPSPDPTHLLNYCKQIKFVPRKPFQPDSKRSLLGFFSRKPRAVVDTFSSSMMNLIMDEILNTHYDLIIASQFDMAIYLEHIESLPAIFEEAEVGVIYEKYSKANSPLLRFRYGLTWMKHRRYLNALLKHFRVCTVVSSNEYNMLKIAAPEFNAIELIPNFLNLNDYQKEETSLSNHIVFTGSFSYNPNYEGMCWFLNEVFPKILERLPDVQLTITGDPANRFLPEVTNVNQVGVVEDVRPYITRSSCSIVPLHIGGGTRLKILEAMALGTPVISTSKGAEGLNVQHGVHLLIADEPDSFSSAVIQILEDTTLQKNISDNAYKLVGDEYSSTVIIPRYLYLIDKTRNIFL